MLHFSAVKVGERSGRCWQTVRVPRNPPCVIQSGRSQIPLRLKCHLRMFESRRRHPDDADDAWGPDCGPTNACRIRKARGNRNPSAGIFSGQGSFGDRLPCPAAKPNSNPTFHMSKLTSPDTSNRISVRPPDTAAV